jgi:hypothetical protein
VFQIQFWDMETKHCNYCGYFGKMPFIHGIYHCPNCKYALVPGENEDDQDLYDDDLLEQEEYPIHVIEDLVLQRS